MTTDAHEIERVRPAQKPAEHTCVLTTTTYDGRPPPPCLACLASNPRAPQVLLDWAKARQPAQKPAPPSPVELPGGMGTIEAFERRLIAALRRAHQDNKGLWHVADLLDPAGAK